MSVMLRRTFVRSFATAQKIKKKILIPTTLPPIVSEMLAKANFEVVMDKKTPLAELIKAHPETYGIIVRSEKIDGSVMDALPNLKVICRAGAGFNTIDTKLARKKGVDVMNTPGANANAVAEEVVAMVLASWRHVIPADASCRSGLWEKSKFTGRELANKTVGVVGLGAIGQLVVRRMKGFECTFLGVDPVLSPERARSLGVKLVTMEELFAQSDVITLHIPENNDTKRSIGADLFALVKEGACVVNCAREGIIDEQALFKAKATKKFFYCNDVYTKDIAGDKSIAGAADIMLPHLGASTQEANMNAATRAANQITEWSQTGVRRYVVNMNIPEALDENYQQLAYYCARVARQFAGPTTTPQRIETRFYGGLYQYTNWLAPSVVMGLGADFDPSLEWNDAAAQLERMGIEYTNVDTNEEAQNNTMQYSTFPSADLHRAGDSISVQLLAGKDDGTFETVSVRGTLAEGRPIISRIQKYEGCYFDPTKATLLLEYADRPGVLATVTQLLAYHKINILDCRAPQADGKSMAIMFIDNTGHTKQEMHSLMNTIGTAVAATKCFYFDRVELQ